MANTRHCKLAVKFYDPYCGNPESTYLSEASTSLGTYFVGSGQQIMLGD